MGLMSFLSKLFKPKSTSPSRIGRLTYAVGDIHGCDDLFARMLEAIANDARQFDEKPCLVLLGDYVDRGPKSAQVMQRIVALQTASWCELIVLKGNHEHAMLRFLQEPAYGQAWTEYGGATTLASYEIAAPQLRSDVTAWEGVRDAFKAAIEGPQLDLLHAMKVVYNDADYLFVHAGVSPDKHIMEQNEDTFLWIRGAFLAVEKACDYVVVHGHTPRDQIDNLRWRVGLDTGAYATGVLSAIRLFEHTRHTLQVGS